MAAASSNSQPLVWFITGMSSGLGRFIALNALSRGDKVIVTDLSLTKSAELVNFKAQNASSLHKMEFDVTADLAALEKKAEEAVKVWGRVDVVVNNAAYLDIASVEEATPEQSLAQYQTNVFGGLNTSRAFLPHMRERKSGIFVFMGSMAGWIASPGAALYASTKYAVRCLSESLHIEVAPLGLRSICVDFGHYRTELLGPVYRVTHESRLKVYAQVVKQTEDMLKGLDGNQPGDPEKAAKVIIDVVKGEGGARGKPSPTVLTLGEDCYGAVKEYCESTLKRLEEWQEVSCSTNL